MQNLISLYYDILDIRSLVIRIDILITRTINLIAIAIYKIQF